MGHNVARSKELSMDTLQGVVVWLLFAAVVVGVAINAASMLVSPRAWRHLPSWLRAKTQFGEHSYAAGWGAWLGRIAVAILLGAMLWILYEVFVRR